MRQSNRPEAIGISSQRLEDVYRFLEECVQSEKIPGVSILVARGGILVTLRRFGVMFREPYSRSIQSDTIFLVASVTKPVTVAAVMLLVERGQILLDDPVCSIIPEFGNQGKEQVTLRHLMTHTSGLPDMLPENQQLREKHAPLEEFVRQIYDLELGFPPGTNIQYQSCGIAILGEIVTRMSGLSLPEFLQNEIFLPLRMKDTSLGAEGLREDLIAHVNVGPEMKDKDWGWNTPYWRNFAAPWGGMYSTVGDMFRFCQTFINNGEFDGVQVFSPVTVQAMTTNQTSLMPDIPQHVKYSQAWGLGWRLQSPLGWSYFGDLISPDSYGHGGATGTVVWADVAREMVCILFTTEPSASSRGLLGRCSNLVAASAL